MINAIMTYHFKLETLDESVTLWKEMIGEKIKIQPGFIRVQFYVQEDGTALAIGSWEDQSHADDFMKTGIFAELLKALEGKMTRPPQGKPYALAYFEQNN